jgi:phosphomannomutase
VLANDPDADRLAVGIADGDNWRVLSGNDVGALLGAHILRHTHGDDRVVARSIVSSRLLDRIAADAGVPARTTLTGFKWVSRSGDADHRRLVFGFEEALGYAVTPEVRDKDGITAALAVADLAARGSLQDELDALAQRYGRYETAQWSARFENAAGASVFTAELRRDPPTELAGVPVVRTTDYLHGVDGLPPADLLVLDLADDSRVLLRPSGTEPKVKCYFEVIVGATEHDEARARLDALRTAFEQVASTMPR